MSDLRRTRWTWTFLVARTFSAGLVLAGGVSLILNIGHPDNSTRYLAQAALACTAVFWFLSWFPRQWKKGGGGASR
ncbi:hypothetical protein ACWEOI_12015 [Nocardia sp. NPDC004340]